METWKELSVTVAYVALPRRPPLAPRCVGAPRSPRVAWVLGGVRVALPAPPRPCLLTPRDVGRCSLPVLAGPRCCRSPSFPGVHRVPTPLSAVVIAVRLRACTVLAYLSIPMAIVILLLAGATCGLLGGHKFYLQRPINIQVPMCRDAAGWLALFMSFSLLILPIPCASGPLLGPRLGQLGLHKKLLGFGVPKVGALSFASLVGCCCTLFWSEFSRMSIVQLSFSRLLDEICQKLGFRVPDCVATVGGEGWYVAYIDLPIARNGAIVEIARCWGAASPYFLLAKDDSACVAIHRMKSELDLHIKDINYDDCIMYKSMYDNVMVQSNNLLDQLNKLKREHSVLRDCYASSIAEKVRYIDENLKLARAVADQRTTIERLHATCTAMATDPSESSSGS
uniref:Uncharacterized protein n=1 Tax=Ananas comosus var. bracteatus TaxID=296719 RepID=A0A6V7QGZ1_ANACO|nr:unnamed protein product [Ananas comosus var. bracteatus]